MISEAKFKMLTVSLRLENEEKKFKKENKKEERMTRHDIKLFPSW